MVSREKRLGNRLEKHQYLEKLLLPYQKEKIQVSLQKRNVIFGAKKELKEAIASRDMDEIRRVRNKFPKELRIYGIIRAINSKRQKLTSLRNKLIRAEKTAKNKDVYEARIKRLDKQIQALIGRVIL